MASETTSRALVAPMTPSPDELHLYGQRMGVEQVRVNPVRPSRGEQELMNARKALISSDNLRPEKINNLVALLCRRVGIFHDKGALISDEDLRALGIPESHQERLRAILERPLDGNAVHEVTADDVSSMAAAFSKGAEGDQNRFQVLKKLLNTIRDELLSTTVYRGVVGVLEEQEVVAPPKAVGLD